MKKSITVELYEALAKLLEIKYRMAGCKDDNCTVCKENKAAYNAAAQACARYDLHLAKKGHKK